MTSGDPEKSNSRHQYA